MKAREPTIRTAVFIGVSPNDKCSSSFYHPENERGEFLGGAQTRLGFDSHVCPLLSRELATPGVEEPRTTTIAKWTITQTPSRH